MRYSISMYRGGFQIDAENCDHTSAKNLGLICPFCKEAVFYRSGSKYSKADKTVIVKPSFVHYAIDGDELTAGLECENRAKRQEGIDYLARLKIESKNQRLKLYNDHLWDMMSKGMPEAEKIVKLVNNTVPQKYRNLFVLHTRKFFTEHKGYGVYYIKRFYDLSIDNSPLRLKIIEGIDIKIEESITLEVLNFLVSKTGQSCLSKLILLSIPNFLCDFYRGIYNTNNFYGEQVFKIAPSICNMVDAFSDFGRKKCGFTKDSTEYKGAPFEFEVWAKPFEEVLNFMTNTNFSLGIEKCDESAVKARLESRGYELKTLHSGLIEKGHL